MKEIPLTQGKVALVDDEDYASVSEYKWYAVHVARNHWYAQTGKGGIKTFMHRFILRPDQSLEIDHINSDGLDNRRSNLRAVTHQENLSNRRLPKNNKTGYKGISYNARRIEHPWRAMIGLKGALHHIGVFATAEEAAHAYDEAAIKYHGAYARLNFPRIQPEPVAAPERKTTRSK